MGSDMRLVAEPLRLIAYETAAMLGPDWKVEGLLSTAMVVHPIGFRVALDDGIDTVQLTAYVSVSRDQRRPLETVNACVVTDDVDRSVTVQRTAQAIRTEILPHFGREDALAGLRVLSLPLREAGINASTYGTRRQMIIEYRKELLNVRTAQFKAGERRPLGVIITALGDDSTRVEVRIPHLPIREAARITQGLRPGLGHPMRDVKALPEEVRSEVAVTFPGLTAKHVVNNVPQYTDLTDDTGVLTIRHALIRTREDNGIRTESYAAVWLRGATVAQAYTVLAAYAA